MNGLILCFGIGVMACLPSEQPKATVVVCPPIVEWKSEDQRAASEALKSLPVGHPLRKMAVVAVNQRKINRACK